MRRTSSRPSVKLGSIQDGFRSGRFRQCLFMQSTQRKSREVRCARAAGSNMAAAAAKVLPVASGALKVLSMKCSSFFKRVFYCP